MLRSLSTGRFYVGHSANLAKRVTAATAPAEKLTRAMLAKAFRGKLVATEAELAHCDGRSFCSSL